MKNIIVFILVLCGGLGFSQTAMQSIKGGSFVPLYGLTEDSLVVVEPFYMDKTPVTNKEYLEFVNQNKLWKKSKVPALYADDRYLQNWSNDTSFAKNQENYPVTNVSWFAAKNYCAAQGKRLPTLNEWEFAAMASPEEIDARKDAAFTSKILSGYETPNTYLQNVGEDEANYWGVHNLHGMVWEWTSDFNSVMLSSENRNNNDTNLFCGAGAIGASDLMNYAAFMRYAMRASVKAKYSMQNMGFRCAKNK